MAEVKECNLDSHLVDHSDDRLNEKSDGWMESSWEIEKEMELKQMKANQLETWMDTLLGLK
jgi:hypothetical protein